MIKQRPTTAKPALNQREIREMRELDQAQFQSIGSNMSNFIILNELGKGSYGVVYKVKSTIDHNIYVLKKIDLTHLKPKQQSEALKEAQLLRKLKHPHIISYYVSFIENDFLCIVMEYAEGGDLQKFLREYKERRKYLAEDLIWDMCREIVAGLQHIHENNIIHRDIKTLNVFLTKDKRIKLGDLGVSKIFNSDIAMEGTRVGTPLYLSPELVQHQPYDYKVDVWALGCVVFQMSALEAPFQGENLIALGYSIVNKSPKQLPPQYSPRLHSLIWKLLEKVPGLRPTMQEINNQFFNKQDRYTKDRIQVIQQEQVNQLYDHAELPARPQTSQVRPNAMQQQETEKIRKTKKILNDIPLIISANINNHNGTEHTQRQVEISLSEDRQQQQRIQYYQNQIREQQEKIEREERENAEKERIERERLEKEKLQRERQEKLDRERLEREARERDRLDRERQEMERQERERLDKERIEKEQIRKKNADQYQLYFEDRAKEAIIAPKIPRCNPLEILISEQEDRKSSFTYENKPKNDIKRSVQLVRGAVSIRPLSAQTRVTSFTQLSQCRAKLQPQTQNQSTKEVKKFTIFDLQGNGTTRPQESQELLMKQSVPCSIHCERQLDTPTPQQVPQAQQFQLIQAFSSQGHPQYQLNQLAPKPKEQLRIRSAFTLLNKNTKSNNNDVQNQKQIVKHYTLKDIID